MAKLTARQRKELQKITRHGYAGRSPIERSIYRKLSRRGYLHLVNVEIVSKEGEYAIGIISYTDLRDVPTAKGKQALR
ncbi:MAG: hypothetical protein U0X20_07925 [Caldilineaceae bacterium]